MKWVAGLVVINLILCSWRAAHAAPATTSSADKPATALDPQALDDQADDLAQRIHRAYGDRRAHELVKEMRAQGPLLERAVLRGLLSWRAVPASKGSDKQIEKALELVGAQDSMLASLARLSAGGEAPFEKIRELVRATIDAADDCEVLWAERLMDFDDLPSRRLAEVLGTGDQKLRNDVLVALTAFKRPLPLRLVKAIKPEPELLRSLAATLLQGDGPNRRNAVTLFRAAGVETPAQVEILKPLLRDPDLEIRCGAAQALNETWAYNLARSPRLIEDLKSDDPVRRVEAAHQMARMGQLDAKVTRALIHATEQRNLLAREGLIAGIEAAARTRDDVVGVLEQTALAPAAETGARARAALREIAIAGKERP